MTRLPMFHIETTEGQHLTYMSQRTEAAMQEVATVKWPGTKVKLTQVCWACLKAFVGVGTVCQECKGK